MKTLRCLIICVCILNLPQPGCAAGAGKEPFNFLFLDVDARAVGMGGAYTALADNVNALHYNPGGLGKNDFHQLTFMENRYVQGVSQEYLGFAAKQKWAVNLNYLSFGKIPRTTLSEPEGSGSYGITDLSLGAGLGRTIGGGLNMGVGVKYIREALDDVTANGYALDVGVLYSTPSISGLTLGMAVQNIGPPVKFQGSKEDLPLNIRLGSAYKHNFPYLPATFSFDITKEKSEDLIFCIGTEFFIANTLPIRLGFNTRNDADSGITFGLGWVFRQFNLNYAFVPLGELGNSHRFGLTIKFEGTFLPPPPPTPELVLPSEVAESEEYTENHSGKRSSLVDARFHKVEDFLKLGFLKEAKAELQGIDLMLSEDDRRWIRFYERLGHIYILEKDYNFARFAYSRAIEHARKTGLADRAVGRAYAGLGQCLFKQGEKEKAKELLHKALSILSSKKSQEPIRAMLLKIEKMGNSSPE